jgi:hypothetical protein
MALEVGGAGTQNPATGASPARAAPTTPPQAPPRRSTLLPQPSAAANASVLPTVGRRRRMIVRRLDLWSVLKVSLCFYLAGLAVVMVSGIVLWLIASSVGVVENVEQFMGDLLSAEDFRFLSAEILEGAALIGLVLVVLLVIVTLLAAAFYNLFAELIGGVEVVVEDE